MERNILENSEYDSDYDRKIDIEFKIRSYQMPGGKTGMKNKEIKEICLELMNVDSEEEVIGLLKNLGYWSDEKVWRYYGDYENNYNNIGNQQSRPEAALVEKLVNSIDARLMNSCLEYGIDPEGSAAPQNIRTAIAQFFEKRVNTNSGTAGIIEEWTDMKRTNVAKGITLAATGMRSKPCFTISDVGEGQTPEMFPKTFLSLTGNNKLRIPFVQGKFNMGGTGVLKFCGRKGLQLIVSRRNPALNDRATGHKTDGLWGFTIVRREDPVGNRRNSVYTYLAPINAGKNPKQGGVLSFSSDKLPIFPEGRNPYARDAEHGTLIKLYEYATKYRTNMLLSDGIMRPLELLLAEVALPIRLYECRDYKGHAGSFENTLIGLRTRLKDNKANNIEEGFPDSSALQVSGEQMKITIYAFKKDKADVYRGREGIIFTINGQTHGYLTWDFFRRKKVGMGYLRRSIFVVVDCTNFSGRGREDLFMNSRDRLSDGELRNAIEKRLENLLRKHSGLRKLKERRRREELESKLDDSKPLEDILESLLEHSPTLSKLFLEGKRLSVPFKTIQAQSEEKRFEGKQYPSYFKFKDLDYGTELHRGCHINMRCRIIFETDVANDYFTRDIDQGEFSLHLISKNSETFLEDYIINLHNGIATLSLELPASATVGDELKFEALVKDRTRFEPFKNIFSLKVKGPVETTGGRGKRRNPPEDKPGASRELPSGIALPDVIEVHEEEWQEKIPPFDQYTALRIIHAETIDNQNSGEVKSVDVYDFFVNMDNIFLKSELKKGIKDEVDVTNARFKYGLVLLGLALLHEDAQMKKKSKEDSGKSSYDNDQKELNIEDEVEKLSRATASILLPMIESLGELELDEA